MSQTFEPQILNHPLIQHKISLMRKKETGSKDFRELASEVATLMCYEATRDLPLKEVTIETPICRCQTKMLPILPGFRKVSCRHRGQMPGRSSGCRSCSLRLRRMKAGTLQRC